ncbi:MAG: hypothetical protein IPL23_05995 [Saprospiraceae bacterium]|nr:hypothetical protein [Saprospiraceae bacterium]
MPIEAPGRTANYIGLQIVKKYMESDDVLTLDALIENKDVQKILDSSGYKPKKKITEKNYKLITLSSTR